MKELIRETEALVDESTVAFARLKQSMPAALPNPIVEVDTDQRALLRLRQTKGQAMSMAINQKRMSDESNNFSDGTPYSKENETPMSVEVRSDD
ncbi:MAG: hypothetical protein ABJ311_00350 [Erythrobacter sp.]